jgi:hypothetical protein
MAIKMNDITQDRELVRLIEALKLSYTRRFAPQSEGSEGGPYFHLLIDHPLGGKIRIEVRMEKNHSRPHFHAKCSDVCDISVDIKTTETLAGNCKSKILKKIQIWAFGERQHLLSTWQLLNDNQKVDFSLEA